MANPNSPSIHEEADHGTVGSYVVGFILSVVLTAGSFWAVMHGGFSTETAVLVLAALAAVQIVVHVYFFLHLSSAPSQRWNVTAFVFTVLVVAIVIVGTLWIMNNVAMNMMSR